MSLKEPSRHYSLAATGVDPGIISNRISHVFDLKGPSIAVNTACSSSVYAMHNACNALGTKETSAAVVGSVNLVLTGRPAQEHSQAGRAFSISTTHTLASYSEGYGRAEVVGAVYFWRLSDAIRDGTQIRGVIAFSATTNSGKVREAGIRHPSFAGPRNVIKHASRRGGQVDPLLTGYFKCHGTGTIIWDSLEVQAVADSMNDAQRESDGPLHVDAVKTNIGQAASGLSAVIKQP